METIQNRLPILQNRRRMALAGFERALALRCGVIRPRYLPLEESARLFDWLVSGPVAHHATGRLPRPLMEEILRRAQARFADEPCLVFLYNSSFAGGIEMPLPIFWAKAMDLLDFDGDVVFAASRDGGQGLMLDFDARPLCWSKNGPGSYELFAWGPSWPRRVPSFGEAYQATAYSAA